MLRRSAAAGRATSSRRSRRCAPHGRSMEAQAAMRLCSHSCARSTGCSPDSGRACCQCGVLFVEPAVQACRAFRCSRLLPMLIVGLPQERLWLVVHRCVQACLLVCCMVRVYSHEGLSAHRHACDHSTCLGAYVCDAVPSCPHTLPACCARAPNTMNERPGRALPHVLAHMSLLAWRVGLS